MSVEWEKYQKGRNNKKEGNELFGKESFFKLVRYYYIEYMNKTLVYTS